MIELRRILGRDRLVNHLDALTYFSFSLLHHQGTLRNHWELIGYNVSSGCGQRLLSTIYDEFPSKSKKKKINSTSFSFFYVLSVRMFFLGGVGISCLCPSSYSESDWRLNELVDFLITCEYSSRRSRVFVAGRTCLVNLLLLTHPSSLFSFADWLSPDGSVVRKAHHRLPRLEWMNGRRYIDIHV